MIDCAATKTKVLGFYALHPRAKLPMKQTHGAACFDIHACCDDLITLNPGERALIPTGLIFDIPEDHSVRIHTRSSWAAIKGIGLSVSQGIIDSDYVEEVFVPMVNNTDKLFHIRSGERIAQIELVKTIPTINTWIEDRPTKRGNRDGGFGSTDSMKGSE